jgi:hypothetical protein
MSEPLPEKTDLIDPIPDPDPAAAGIAVPENEPPVPLSNTQVPGTDNQPTLDVKAPADVTTTTLLNVFTSIASGAESSSWDVLECGKDIWSYHQLDVISTGLAIELYEAYGSQPTVAFLSENHPYMLALILATWKLGGIIAPYDPHAPDALLEGMMQKVSPACIVTPSTNTAGRKIAQGALFRSLVISQVFADYFIRSWSPFSRIRNQTSHYARPLGTICQRFIRGSS